MSYEQFVNVVLSKYTRKAGCRAVFDHVDGKHIARCSDGVLITSNAISRSLSVKWGSGHEAILRNVV